jgi:DNA-binding NarL/FixJ family response regulator
MPINVLIADDHAIARRALCRMLESHCDFRVVATVANGREAVSETRRLAPQVVVMDVAMPGLNGISATRRIMRTHPEVAVLMLSETAARPEVQHALQAGARGYLIKAAVVSDLVKAVRTLAEETAYFGAGIAEQVAETVKAGLASLTPAQRDILLLMAAGKSNAEIAAGVGLSPGSVETSRAIMMRKLQIKDAPALVKFVLKHGVTSLD